MKTDSGDPVAPDAFHSGDPVALPGSSMERVAFDWRRYFSEEPLPLMDSEKPSVVDTGLPILQYEEAILENIASSQVSIIKAATGAGKSTQIPQIIYRNWIRMAERDPKLKIVVSQPRRIAATSLAVRVAEEIGLGEVGKVVGYQIALDKKIGKSTRIIYCTAGVLLRVLVSDPELSAITHIVLDEVHERNLDTDFLMQVLRGLAISGKRPDLKIILMSATIDETIFVNYFSNNTIPRVLEIPGKQFSVEEIYLQDIVTRVGPEVLISLENAHVDVSRIHRNRLEFSKQFQGQELDTLCRFSPYCNLSKSICKLIEWIHFNDQSTMKDKGAILVFLPGWKMICECFNFLAHLKRELWILKLHGEMPSSEQKKVFIKVKDGRRKVILSTSIAETSITIDDIDHVIDSGLITDAHSEGGIRYLKQILASKVNIEQRKGRTGRTGPGKCWRFYPKYLIEELSDHPTPQICKAPLHDLSLLIRSMKFSQGKSIQECYQDSLTIPSDSSISDSITLLQAAGLMKHDEKLTLLGHCICRFPMECTISKALILGCLFQCIDPVLTVVSGLYKDPFSILVKPEDVCNAKRKLAEYPNDDFSAIVGAYQGWLKSKESECEETFCSQHFLSPDIMDMIHELRNLYRNCLAELGFLHSELLPSVNLYSGNWHTVQTVIFTGLFPNMALRMSDCQAIPIRGKLIQPLSLISRSFKSAITAPHSIYFGHKDKNFLDWIMFHSVFQNSGENSLLLPKISSCAPIPLGAILLLSPRVMNSEEGTKTVQMKLTQEVELRLLFDNVNSKVNLQKLHVMLCQLLDFKLSDPAERLPIMMECFLKILQDYLQSFNTHPLDYMTPTVSKIQELLKIGKTSISENHKSAQCFLEASAKDFIAL